MKPTRLALLALLGAWSLFLSGGCAWFLLGAGGIVTYTAVQGEEEESNNGPTAQVGDPGRILGATATIPYSLRDDESDPCSVAVRYSLDGGLNFSAATPAAGGDGTSGLATSPAWISHDFVWDRIADTGGGLQLNVVVEITPTDGQGAAGPSSLSPVFIAGNSAPSVSISAIPDASKGIILVSFQLTDASSDLVDIDVDYSLDGTNYSDAAVVLGALTGLSASPSGTPNALAWDTEADAISQNGSEKTVTLRISLVDEFGLAGAPGETPPFRLGNEKPEAELVYHNWGYTAGSVQAEVLVKDAEADTCTLGVEYSIDGGRTWGVAALVGDTNPVSGLTSSATGVSRNVTWDFGADGVDISQANNDNVRLRFTPADPFNAIGSPTQLRVSVGYGFGNPFTIVSQFGFPMMDEHDPSAVFDPGDALHVVWWSEVATPAALNYRCRNADGTWTAAAPLSTPATDDSKFPDLAAESDGDLHLVWVESDPGLADDIYYKRYDGSSATWEAANVNISNTTLVHSGHPLVAVDSSGHVHVVWVESGTPSRFHYSTNATGSWSATVDITPSNEPGYVYDPALCANGPDLELVWANVSEIMHLHCAAGTWASTATDLTTAEAGACSYPAVAAHVPSGLVLVAYKQDKFLRYTAYTGTWSAPATAHAFEGACDRVSLAAGPDAVFHAVVRGGSTGSSYSFLNYFLQYSAGAWSAPRNLHHQAGRAFSHEVAVNSAGFPTALWEDAKDFISPGDMSTWSGIYANDCDQRWIGLWDMMTVDAGENVGRGAIAAGPGYRFHSVFVRRTSNPALLYRVFEGILGEIETVNGTSTETPDSPAIAVDGAETPHVLWVETAGSVKRVHYNSRAGTAWGTPEAISSDQGDASEPALAVDASGDLHAVWVRVAGADTPVYYAARPASTGVWSAPVVISQATGICSSPAVALDDAGNAHVVYSRHTGLPSGSQVYYVTDSSASWSAPALQSGTDVEAVQPHIAASGSGVNLSLTLVWGADGTLAKQAARLVRYATGGWGTIATVCHDGDADDEALRPRIVKDPSGDEFLVMGYNNRGNGMAEIWKNESGAWALRRYVGYEDLGHAFIDGAVDSLGHFHFLIGDGVDDMMYTHRK